jgi:hypothetical protein
LAFTTFAVVALIPSAAVIAGISRALCRDLFPAPDLGSFRVGATVAQDSSKALDFLFPVVFYGILTLGGVVASSYKATLRRFKKNKIEKIVLVEFFISLPFLITVIIGSGFPLLKLIDSPFLLCVLVQFSVALTSAPSNWYAFDESGPTVFAKSMFFGALCPFAALGLTVLSRVALPNFFSSAERSITNFIFLSLLTMWCVRKFLGSDHGKTARYSNWLFITLAIVSTPLLLPPVLYYRVDKIGTPGVQLSSWLIFIGLLSALGLVETAYRTRDSHRSSPYAGLSSMGLVIFLILLRRWILWPELSSDGFHFGEFFTPFELWDRFRQMPYTDIMPSHGVILSYIPGMWNHLLNDGSATSWGYGRFAGLIVISFIAHLMLRPAVGVLIATSSVFLLACTSWRNEGEMLVISLLIATIYIIRRNKSPEVIGLVCLLCCSATVYLYPMWGVVAILSVLFILTIGMFGGIISGNRKERFFVFRMSLALVSMAIVLMFGPSGNSLYGAIRYVLNSGGDNSDAYGISLDAILKIPFVLGVPMSFIFVLGLFFSLFITWKEKRHFLDFNWAKGVDLGLLLLPGFLVTILMGRFLGRVDNVAWSFRPTSGSLLVLGFVVPFVVTQFGNIRWKMMGNTSLCIALLLSIVVFPIGQGGLIRSATMQLETPLAWETAKLNLVNNSVGVGRGDKADIAFLTFLSEVISKIDKDEIVLNVSNRVSLNGLFDWKSPTKILTPYTLTSDQDEANYISQIQLASPKFIFVGPGVWHDGFSLGLRNPLVYRWVLENYNPFQCGPSFWAIEKRSDLEDEFEKLGCPSDSVSTFSDAITLWSNFVGPPKDLLKIPQAWGKRGSSLLTNQRSLLTVSSDELTDGFINFELIADAPTSILEKLDFDFLSIESVCSNAQDTDTSSTTSLVPSSRTAALKWGAGANDYSTFEWSGDKLTIPLDVFPSWFLNVAARSPLILKVPLGTCFGKLDIQAKGIKRQLPPN